VLTNAPKRSRVEGAAPCLDASTTHIDTVHILCSVPFAVARLDYHRTGGCFDCPPLAPRRTLPLDKLTDPT
jgi:hypothetical protein